MVLAGADGAESIYTANTISRWEASGCTKRPWPDRPPTGPKRVLYGDLLVTYIHGPAAGIDISACYNWWAHQDSNLGPDDV